MTKQYQLIHIDNKEVTMCEKITIEGKDYYYNSNIKLSEDVVVYNNNLMDGVNDEFIDIIATTDTSLQCPQVVDYVEELGYSKCNLAKDYMDGEDYNTLKAFKLGFNQHSETHSLSDEEVSLLIEWLFSQNTIGTPIPKLIEKFKTTLPTKVYYR